MPGTPSEEDDTRDIVRAWRLWVATLALGVGVSFGIEVSQLAISVAIGVPYRHADLDDVILNGLGTAIGYGTWAAVSGVLAR
jgi:glycopeptide antibiotics resistance protein